MSSRNDEIRSYISRIEQIREEKMSVLLSGSTGWGIPEGEDGRADWDIHIIMRDDDYDRVSEGFGPILDDPNHNPPIFIQIRPMRWLEDRLTSPDTDLLYIWIYRNGTWICDDLGLQSIVSRFEASKFDSFERLCMKEFVRFSVRRLDTASSSKRCLKCASMLYAGEMVQAALRTYCVLNRCPYPYNKWLPKQVELLGAGGQELISYCEKCLETTEMCERVRLAKRIKHFLELEAIEIFGRQRWITHWWEYNEN